MSDLGLAGLACAEGGWCYGPDQQAHLEPTCLALLALADEKEQHADLVAKSLAFLETCAAGDGTYRLARGRHEAAWPTALVLFTLAELEAVSGRSVSDGAAKNPSFTVGARTNPRLDGIGRALLTLRGRLMERDGEETVNDIDGTLVGWPWAEGTFSWVEPTAWACLALTRIGQGHHPRVAEGQNLLLDRVLATGGVNYGNRRIFGITLEAIPTPTALALLALQHRRDDERVLQSVEYLRTHALTSDDVEHLAWATLALDAFREPGEASATIATLQDRLRGACAERTATPYLRESPVRQAVVTLALDVDRRNPFRLPATTPSSPVLPVGALRTASKPLGQRVRSFLQGLAVNATGQLRPLEAAAEVHVAPVTDYNADIADVLTRQYEHFRQKVPLKGKRVVLKPNLVEYHREKVINTHPHVVAATIELCQREGAAEVIVAEGPGHWRNVEHLVKASGLGDVLRHHKVRFVDLNHDEPVRALNLGRLTKLEYLYLTRTVASADVVISLPKLKTHHWAGATLSLKNLFGTLPGTCYGWPKNELHWRGIDNSIVDIAATRTPDLAVVDGIVGMEGDGPLNGTPKRMGVVVMGSDLVAVDATCCRLMQLDPTKIGYLVMGHGKKLGQLTEAKIQQLGETIADRMQPFDTVAQFRPLWTGRREPTAVVATTR